MLVAISNADTASREETCQPAFGAPPPTDLLPFLSSQQRFSRDWRLCRDIIFAGLSSLRDREDQSNVGGIDILSSRQAYRVVPLLAGAFRMPQIRFQIANWTSSLLWAAVWLGPGYVEAKFWP